MAKREILLHVGHGKTGSSFIQSSLVLSQAALLKSGIAYPIGEKSAQAGMAGHISSGNLKHGTDALQQVLRSGFEGGNNRVLVSSESLFLSLLGEMSGELADLPRQFPGASLRVLLYIRDPLDHAVSVYQQMIKRGGFTGTFADSLQAYRIPVKVAQFVRKVESDGGQVTILNYSRHSKRLLTTVEGWLGLPDGSLVKPPVETVNRSMTLAELELQRQFNALFGKEARRYVSDALCNRLPEIRSETPTLSRGELAEFLGEMNGMIRQPGIESVIPPDEAYRLPELDEVAERFAPVETDFPFAFSAAQLKVIAEAIRTETQRQINRNQAKRKADTPVPVRATRQRRV